MSLKIKELPITERPYEKLEMYGEKMLSNSELLAIIIKNGTKDFTAIDISNAILKKVNNNLRDLQDIPLHEFKEIQGIGKVKAIQLKAICELTKRISRPINDAKIQIKNTDDIAKILIEELKYEKREIVKLVLLNTKNIILKIIDISFGGTSSAFVKPKDILLEAIKIGAPKIIIAHNHPSGDPTPSLADFEITNRIEKAGQIMGIELLDHIVIGDCNYISIFSKRGVNNV
jgi:DNA repair protein RadC